MPKIGILHYVRNYMRSAEFAKVNIAHLTRNIRAGQRKRQPVHLIEPERNFVVSYLSGILPCLAAGFVLRLVLAPRAPGLRLMPVSDGAAEFFFNWLAMLTAAAGPAQRRM